MIEHVHKHITSELQQNAKTDIIFILASIALNLIALAINAGSVEKSRTDDTALIVMFIFVADCDVHFCRAGYHHQPGGHYRPFKRQANPHQTAERTNSHVQRSAGRQVL